MKNILIISIILFSFSFKSKAVDIFDLWDVPLLAPSDCMDYCITGTCSWLKCSWKGCKVRVSMRVRHRVPDLIVSAYSEVGENPWDEFRAIYGGVQKSVAQEVVSWIGSSADVGGGEAVTTSEQETKSEVASTVFREVDVVGNWFDFSKIAGDIYCGTNTTPFVPHYSSAVDAYLWRTGLTDILHTLDIFTEVIGIPYIKEWGSVYWRTGFIKQMNPAKTNAVLAFRAAHIATRTNQGRVYNSATGTPSSGHRYYQIPAPIEVDGSDDSLWQMVSPKKDNTCYIFDDIAENEDINESNWADGRWEKNNSSAVYKLWRKYECCKDRGHYLFTVKYTLCL